ncbi:MAG: amino acid adenylation domain-containing protein [Candidatus Methylumidiphilus sp.]
MNNNNLPDPTAALDYHAQTLIYQAFLAQAKATPDASAIISCHGTCSYAQLEQVSRQLALCLLAYGVAPQATVSILSDRNPGLVYAMLAVSRAGAAFNIADSAYPTARILLTLQLLKPAVLLVCGDVPIPHELQQEIDAGKPLAVIKVPAPIDEACAAFAEFSQDMLNMETAAEDTAYIMFTSGSTGQPKGIATGHAPLPHFIAWHVAQHGLTKTDQFAMLSGLSHDPVLRDVFTPLSIGATLCIPKQATIFDPADLFDWLAQHDITVCHLTPALGEIIATGADTQDQALPKLRYFFWGGDVLSLKTHRRLRHVAPHAKQVNFYGATETPQAMAYFAIPENWLGGAFPLGQGIADAQLLLVTEAGQLAQTGELGEIWIRSPYLSQGYINDLEQTHTRFVDNPFSGVAGDFCYRTGDLGKYLSDGNVMFAGRMDHQIKIRGFRVEPGEVASTIERYNGVARAVVLAKDSGRDSKILVGYFSAAAGQTVAQAEVLESLRNKLPAYMVPAFLVPMAKFPLLPNGKIDLQALPEPSQEDAPATGAYVAPCNEREAELAHIWQDILGLDKVGVNDNFLALGGDSLSALKALARMKKLGIPSEVARGIFQGKTIQEIVGEEGGGQTESTGLAAELRTNLLINIVRGILLILVVADHWFEGLLNHLAGKGKGGFLLEAVSPLFNIATPGFAFVFGAGLGYLFYAKYQANPAQTRKTMRFGTWLLLAGISADVIMRLAAVPLQDITSTAFFSAFFSPLLYYALALITAPLWFSLIAKTRWEYLACAGLMLCSYLVFKGCEVLLLEREQTGFLQLLRLMLVAKFNYFNMSVGTLGGVMVGMYLKKHYADDLSGRSFGAGVLAAAFGVALLYFGSGSLQGFYDSVDMGLWRWSFYAGLVLIMAGGIAAILKHFTQLPKLARTGLQLCAVLGQGTFPVFVLHGLVLRAKLLLLMAGLPMSAALGIPFALFFGFTGWMLFKLYQLYYASAE